MDFSETFVLLLLCGNYWGINLIQMKHFWVFGYLLQWINTCIHEKSGFTFDQTILDVSATKQTYIPTYIHKWAILICLTVDWKPQTWLILELKNEWTFLSKFLAWTAPMHCGIMRCRPLGQLTACSWCLSKKNHVPGNLTWVSDEWTNWTVAANHENGTCFGNGFVMG